MSRVTTMAVLAGCAFLSWDGTAVFAQSGDSGSVLNQSSTLLKEQQELDARISASRSRLEGLKREQQQLNQQGQQLNDDRQTNQSLCGSPGTYYAMRAECDQQSQDLSNASQNLSRQQREVGQRYQSATSEADTLKKRQERLKEQADDMKQKLGRMDLPVTVKDCMERLKRDDLGSSVSAYQQCSGGTGGAQSQVTPDQPRFPTLDQPGPIEQMGIEDEKRRKRKAREAERGY